MKSSIAQAKASQREELRARLKTLPATARLAASTQLRARLQASALWRAAKSVLFFAPLPDEPDVWPLLADALADGKLVALPHFHSTTQNYEACRIQNPAADLVAGQFGIREPSPDCPVQPVNRLDLLLVPGLGFDPHGRRLGRGKGFYDQLLVDVRGHTCGVAFDEQIVERVPVEPHDIPLNCILTPTRWLEP